MGGLERPSTWHGERPLVCHTVRRRKTPEFRGCANQRACMFHAAGCAPQYGRATLIQPTVSPPLQLASAIWLFPRKDPPSFPSWLRLLRAATQIKRKLIEVFRLIPA
jgi:hypothetical protein